MVLKSFVFKLYVFIFGILAFFLQQNNQNFKFLELCRSTEENSTEVDSIEAYLIGTGVLEVSSCDHVNNYYETIF
jgi:beta-N-acetylglucosaminidase